MANSPRPGSRFTIANVMIVVAVVAVAQAIVLTRGFGSVLISFVVLAGLVFLTSFLTIRRAMELLYGIPCPGCKRRGLERRSILSFGERFFFCTNCGVRCRRSLYGAFGFFVWRDASGREYEAQYQKPMVEDPWNAPPGLEDDIEDAIYSKTHLSLVRNKRLRSPENPNGPGLE